MAELRLILIPALSALGGGAVGAFVTIFALKNDAPRRDSQPRPEPVAEATVRVDPGLDGRVAKVERSLQALALRDGMAQAMAQPADAAAAAEKQPVADVAPIVDNPVFEAAVRDVMDRAEQERSVEREAQRAEWRKRAADEWADELEGKLRLTELQKAKAVEIAHGFWERLRDLRQNDAGPPLSRGEWRARVDELRKSAEDELGKVLDPGQMTSYRELDEPSRLGSQRSLRASQRPGRRAE